MVSKLCILVNVLGICLVCSVGYYLRREIVFPVVMESHTLREGEWSENNGHRCS